MKKHQMLAIFFSIELLVFIKKKGKCFKLFITLQKNNINVNVHFKCYIFSNSKVENSDNLNTMH